MARQVYTAAWVLPISAPPIAGGAVAVDGERIAFVGRREELDSRPEFRDAARQDFGLAAILPGLVNVHAHLELTVMRGFLEDLPFRDWIRKLTRARYERLSDEDLAVSAALGAAEALRAGITTVGDTGDSRAAFDALRASGLRGIAYREVFGPDPAAAGRSFEELKAKVEAMRADETARARVGVSPHAPYTVSGRLFQLVAEYAARERLDVCIHAAESEAEQQFVTRGEGPFADGLRERGIQWQAPNASTVRFLEALGVLEGAPLLIHCVRADAEEVEMIARRGARIAHCPKSNAKLGHGVAPLAAMLAAGVRVGLGTDSVASNNRDDLLEEARFCALMQRAVHQDYRQLDAHQALRLATLDGARALGLGAEVGSLEAGKQADLIVVDLSRTHNFPVHDPAAALVFSAAAEDIALSVVAGRVLFDGCEIKSLDEHALRSQAGRVFDALRAS